MDIETNVIHYPIKIKSTSKFIEELYHCEYGRYEDACNARKANDVELIEMNDYQVVACDFLGRWKSQVELRNDDELCELYYALASGTIGLYMCKTANTMLDVIRPYVLLVKPEIVERWPYQNCA